MYGMVNKAIQQMIIRDYGDEAWECIKKEANISEDIFLSNSSYPDSITYDLVAASSRYLNVDSQQILIEFGKFWVLVTAMEGYGGLMRAGGNNLKDFLINLPNFHTRVSLVFPNLKPPTFQVKNITDNSLDLHYITDRLGLQNFVIGLIEGLSEMYQVKTTTELIFTRDSIEGNGADVFRISW